MLEEGAGAEEEKEADKRVEGRCCRRPGRKEELGQELEQEETGEEGEEEDSNDGGLGPDLAVLSRKAEDQDTRKRRRERRRKVGTGMVAFMTPVPVLGVCGWGWNEACVCVKVLVQGGEGGGRDDVRCFCCGPLVDPSRKSSCFLLLPASKTQTLASSFSPTPCPSQCPYCLQSCAHVGKRGMLP